MAISWIWLSMLSISVLFCCLNGNGAALSAAISQGAADGVTLAIGLAGTICLWTGLARVMERAGATRLLSRLFSPLLRRLFPQSSQHPETIGAISANLTANLLGLGNAATPLGIDAVQKMRARSGSNAASDEMCRLIVLNTASVQLIPASVAALRAAAGARSPFDILPCVWLTSVCSVTAGLLAAFVLGRRSNR